MKAITNTLKNPAPERKSRAKDPPNVIGNCPEFLTWGIVCRKEGKYTSLCLNMADAGMTYQYCGWCEDMYRLLGANKIEIEDLWLKLVLRKPGTRAKTEKLYPCCDMKSLDVILAEFFKQ